MTLERRNIDSEQLIDEETDRDEAVIAADDTGMIDQERLITESELENVEGEPR
jgi:hypothetical protein